MAKYYYQDGMSKIDGWEHCTTTETSPVDVRCGAEWQDKIEDCGDFTAQVLPKDKDDMTWGKQLPLKALGTKRI